IELIDVLLERCERRVVPVNVKAYGHRFTRSRRRCGRVYAVKKHVAPSLVLKLLLLTSLFFSLDALAEMFKRGFLLCQRRTLRDRGRDIDLLRQYGSLFQSDLRQKGIDKNAYNKKTSQYRKCGRCEKRHGVYGAA